MKISLLPTDLPRWDKSPDGDLFAVSVWSDVRPLRGAAGLLDWRLCGLLSDAVRARRFAGADGEKLLLPTRRFPWATVLAVGLGASDEFSEERFRAAALSVFTSLRGLGLRSLAIALPGRDGDRIAPDRSLALLLALAEAGLPVDLPELTIVDSPVALKAMTALLGPRRSSRAPAGRP